MSISPLNLANTLRSAAARRKTTDRPSSIKASAEGAAFFVYDNDGGILKVTVAQYKEPLR